LTGEWRAGREGEGRAVWGAPLRHANAGRGEAIAGLGKEMGGRGFLFSEVFFLPG
jgi:hypothetical protein